MGDGIPVLVKGAAGGIFELLTNQQNIMLAYLGFMDVGPCDNESDQRWWLTNVDTGEVMTLGNSRRAWTLITRRCSFGDNRKCREDDTQKWYRFGEWIVNGESAHCLTLTETDMSTAVYGVPKI